MKLRLLAAAAALSLGGAAVAQAAPSTDTTTTVGVCVPSLVPAGAQCQVVGTSHVGEAGGVPVTWSLYELKRPEGRSGLSVLLTPDPAAPSLMRPAAHLPISADALDSWTGDPYLIAAVVRRDEADYVGMGLRGDEGPGGFSLHRAEPSGWTPISAAGLWPTVGPRLTSLVGPQCYAVAGDVNWRAFALRYDMVSDNGACGTALLDLGVEGDTVKIVGALAVTRKDLTPERPARRRVRRR